MSFWSGETIDGNKSVVSEYDSKRLDCNSYTIRMGNVFYRTSDKEGVSTVKSTLKEGETFIIPAGQFGYLLSKEKITVPTTVMGFISMRTGFKFQGLINVSGFNVDPGYSGQLLFAVYNAGALPVSISEGEPIFKIWFANLDNQNSQMFYKKPGISDIDNSLVRGMSAEILSLQSLSDKIKGLERTVEGKFLEQKPTIDNLTQVWRTITLGVVGAVLIALLSFTLPPLWQAGKNVADIYVHPTATR